MPRVNPGVEKDKTPKLQRGRSSTQGETFLTVSGSGVINMLSFYTPDSNVSVTIKIDGTAKYSRRLTRFENGFSLEPLAGSGDYYVRINGELDFRSSFELSRGSDAADIDWGVAYGLD